MKPKKEESSFLKKRSKRLLILRQHQDPGHGLDRGSGGEVKVFCFFSSEKKTLPCLIDFVEWLSRQTRRLECPHKPSALKKIYLKLGKLGNRNRQAFGIFFAAINLPHPPSLFSNPPV